MAGLPEVGSVAPDFDLPAADGGRLRLQDLRGTPAILFFFPKASTPGWTIEARGFRDAHDWFQAAGCRVVGISRDSVASQKKFADALCLPFPMLCDEDGATCKAYGVSSLVGGLLGFASRASVLLDGEGKVLETYPSVSPSKHAEQVLADLERHAAG